MVGDRLAVLQTQEAMQRQRVGTPPGDLALRLQALELANKQHAEVATWWNGRAADAVRVVGLAEHLDRRVELSLRQDLVAAVIEEMPRRQRDRQLATGPCCSSPPIAQPPHRHVVLP